MNSFEEDSLFVPCLGKIVKGTVFSVIADNLGAHSVGSFVESFSGSYVDFVLENSHSFRNLKSGQGHFLVGQNSNTSVT